jgi:CHAT domain-containing protein
MRSVRFILLLLVVIATIVGPRSHAQDDILLRDEDDVAITKAERQRALDTLLPAAQQLRSSGETARAAVLMNRVGRLQMLLSLPEQALATYQEASEIPGAADNPQSYIDSLNGISAAEDQLRKCQQALPRLQQAISLSEQHQYVAGKAEALLTLSDCQDSDNHVAALKTSQQSLQLWQSINNKAGMARTYAALGHYQLTQSDLVEATESQTAALALWEELKNPPGQAESLIHLGFIEYRRGAWQGSLSYMTRAAALIDEKSEPFMMGQIMSGLGEAFVESGLPEAGLPKFQEASQYFRESKSPIATAVMGWDVGRTHYLLGHYPEALAQLQQTLADGEQIKERAIVAMCHEYLGRTLVAMGDWPGALSHFQNANELYLKVSSPMEAARTEALMGQVFEQQGKIDKAREYYGKSLETFRRLSDRLNESAALYALGRLELRNNKLDEARQYLERSIEATENIRRVSTSTDLAAAFSATIHERYESYVECLMLIAKTRGEGDLERRAFEISESARSRSLIELLRATQASLASGLDPELAEQEKSLRQSLRVKEDYKVQLLARADKQRQLPALESELSDLEAKYKQVTNTIRERYPAYDHISQTGGWTLDQIQQQVIADDDTVLLEYSLGIEKSFVWAVTRDHIKSYELPRRADVDEAAQRVYGLLTTGRDADKEDELRGATRALGQLILLPVAAELSRKRVIVVADGALHYVPFSILAPSSASDEPLIAQTQVINAPSASILGQLRAETARRQMRTRALAAFGDPVFATNYAERKHSSGTEMMALHSTEPRRLQASLRDAEAAGDVFDPAKLQTLFFSRLELANLRDVAGPDSFVATSFDATKEKLTSFNLANFAILHFATHGFLDPKNPENSGLVLSMVDREGRPQNGFVGLQDIYRLQAPVDLVVLSACRTGLGKEVRGEGLIGLTRGFMYAGASSVIASLWTVDDEATSELMKRFYANLLQRQMNPAAALQAAQNSIRSEPQWRSPYFWAAFTLQGEYRQTISPSHSSVTAARKIVLIGVVATLLLGVFGWWFWRRRSKAVSVHGH